MFELDRRQFIIGAATLPLILSGCKSDKQLLIDRYVGLWNPIKIYIGGNEVEGNQDTLFGYSYQMEFHSDGSYTCIEPTMETTEGAWSAEGNKITLINKDNESCVITYDDDTQYLKMDYSQLKDGFDEVILFKKIKDGSGNNID